MAELMTDAAPQAGEATEQTSEFASLLLQEFKPRPIAPVKRWKPPCAPSPSMRCSRPA